MFSWGSIECGVLGMPTAYYHIEPGLYIPAKLEVLYTYTPLSLSSTEPQLY